MFKKNKELRMLTLMALGLSVVGIVFACVAMNVALDNKRAESVWAVNFTSLSEEKSGTASSVIPSVNSTSLSNFKVNLMRSGDSVTYKFRITNDGAVDARLKVMSDIIPTCTVMDMNSSTEACSKISYELTYTDGKAVSTGDIVSAGTSKEAMLTIKYNGDSLTSLEITDLDFILLFEQV